MEINKITETIIGSAIEVHRELGPGLLESAYERCVAIDLSLPGLKVERQVAVPLKYRGIVIDAAYRLDMKRLLPIHQAQVLPYLKLSRIRVGLLINFNVTRVVTGVKRLILD